MGRKAREKAKTRAEKPAREPENPVEETIAPIVARPLDGVLVAGALIVVLLVALWFSTQVNRVFDMPKALALKVGGGLLLAAWSAYGFFRGGFPKRSLRLFAAPVFLLTACMGLSTLASLDPWMSWMGVYERQFGFQGQLGCLALFAVTATCLRSRRGAVMALLVLLAAGGTMGGYGLLQSRGLDPYGFFSAPHNKVYSTLGNATFAGNAIALIFPISSMLAILAAVRTLSPKALARAELSLGVAVGAAFAGFALTWFLQVGPGTWGHSITSSSTERIRLYKLGVSLAWMLLLAAGFLGSFGPRWSRLETEAGRRLADAVATGCLAAMASALLVGLYTTRTRGAWVGTAVALSGGLVLLPLLFDDDPARMRRMRQWGVGALLAAALGGVGFLLAFPNHLVSKTIKSIPAAFDPDIKVYGQGQGTRRYLWVESPLVLLDHDRTLERKQADRQDYMDHAGGKDPHPPEDSLLRRLLVWPLGIGIETYRYAFMSHKSKELEALDPMTNHDNPHNNYLYMLASGGFLGLGAYIWLLWRFLSLSWRHFRGAPRPVLRRREDGSYEGDAVKRHEIRDDAVVLEAEDPPWLARLLERDGLEVTAADGEVVVGGQPKAQLLERLTELSVPTVRARAERAVAFGLLTSFFSYSVYSIAGFDSVACSVFLYLMLGAAAVYFAPAGDDPARPLTEGLKLPRQAGPVVALLLVALGLTTAWEGRRVWRAERAFVGDRDPRTYDEKAGYIEDAIEVLPNESFYHQQLGSTYFSAARAFQQKARGLRAQAQQGGEARAQFDQYTAEVGRYYDKAKRALYSALPHTWAPENVYITLFQVYYAENDLTGAERVLERALMHSPHLAPVRANLSALKLERGAYEEALRDCLWVLDIDPKQMVAHRTCGRSMHKLCKIQEAREHLLKAKRYGGKGDPKLLRWWEELERDRRSKQCTPG